MLVAEPGAEPALLDFFVAAPGEGADPSARAPLVAAEVFFEAAAQVFHVGAAACGVYGTPAGICEAHRRYATVPLAELVAPGRGARARGRRDQRAAGLHLQPARADHARRARRRARSTGSAITSRARATCSPTRSWPTRSSASARRAPRRSTPATSREAACACVGRARRHAHARRPRRLRGDPARADPRRLPRPRRLHQPAAVGGRAADRLRARAAGPRAGAAEPGAARRGDGAGPPRAHAGVPRGPRRAPASSRSSWARTSARRRTSPCSTARAGRAR